MAAFLSWTAVGAGCALIALQSVIFAEARMSDCFAFGVEYTKNTLKFFEDVESAEKCQSRCNLLETCEYFSWNRVSKLCSLTRLEALNHKQPNKDVVSGPNSCLEYMACFDVGGEYTVGAIAVLDTEPILSVEHCQALCYANAECRFFTYHSDARSCTLLDHFDPAARRDTDACTSGPNTCTGLPPRVRIPRPSQVNELPGDLAPPSTSQPNQSSNAGQVDEEQETETLQQGNESSFEGRRTGCALVGAEYRDSTLQTLHDMPSPGACQVCCSNSSKCFVWTWHQPSVSCVFKSVPAPRWIASDNSTAPKTSGAKHCVPLHPPCHKADVHASGQVLRQAGGLSTHEACQVECQKDQRCEVWSWLAEGQRCELQTAAQETQQKRLETRGWVSGPKFCSVEAVCFEQAEYLGYDIASISQLISVFECQQLCTQNDACAFWTWLGSLSTSNLKDKNAL